MFIRTVLLFTVITFANPLVAQQKFGIANSPLSSGSSGTEIIKIYKGSVDEAPRAIEFKEGSVTPAHFLSNINRYFNIPGDFTFVETEANTDDLGMHHRLLKQYYKGIQVEGMGYRVHEKNGFVRSVNGKAVRNIQVDLQTILTEEEAFNVAVQHLHTKDSIFRNGKKLIVSKGFVFTAESFSIAYQFDIDVSLVERWKISIDAKNGQVINQVSRVNSCSNEVLPLLPPDTGTGLTNYYGTQSVLVEKYANGSSRLVGYTTNGVKIETYDYHNASVLALLFGLNVPVYDFYSGNNSYTFNYQKPAVSVQWAAEKAFDYYLKKHNRNSFDNNGGAIKSYVHVDQNMNNAFWTGELLAFGDGSNNNNPLVDLDVVSHELTHGVTQYEAKLQYYNESGALNESFSDIFGKAVEFETFGDTATWQLARHSQQGGFRDFSNPNLKNQPDTYAGDMWYTGTGDNGGVHYNSGVQNFWFYLLCEGGSGVNDHDMPYAINAIGIDAATKISYRNLTEYLDQSSDYLDSRIGSMLAAADLHGKNSSIYQEVDKAWDAVGVIDEPIINSIEAYDITATTVKLKGSLLPRGNSVAYYFEFGTTLSFGSISSSYAYANTVAGIVTGLQSQTKYYLRLVAINENGTTYSQPIEFTTISLAPLVKIKQTVDVTETTASLHGLINPNSLPTSFYFEYGLTSALGFVTPSYDVSDTTEFVNIKADIINLQPRQTYYYRLVATNGFTSSSTETQTLFTAVKPTIISFLPANGSIGTQVNITGHNFNAVAENNIVSFGATRATIISATSTTMTVEVPAGASLAPISIVDTQSGLIATSAQDFVPTFTGDFRQNDLQLRATINDMIVYQAMVYDVDGDHRPDIITRHNTPGFSVFQNVNQGGAITNESFIRNTFPSEFYGNLYLADVDGNGLEDVISLNQNGIRIYSNLSAPGYIFFGVPVFVSTPNMSQLVFDDFDGDGHIDIAGIRQVKYDSLVITIFRNQNPNGYLAPENFEKRFNIGLPYYGNALDSDDLNNDGKPEFIVGAMEQEFICILKNKSNPANFEFEEVIINDSTRARYTDYVTQDINNDGWEDIIAYSADLPGNLSVFHNKGTSSIAMHKPVVVGTQARKSLIQFGDLNGDSKVDMLSSEKQGIFKFLKNTLQNSPSFENFAGYGEFNDWVANQGSMIVNDLNGDGRPEVINSYSYSNFANTYNKLEIWQNSVANCVDASLITLNVSRNSATIILPPNTTFDQFEIDLALANSSTWNRVYSTTINYLSTGTTYKLRARAKCYLGYTNLYNINFSTPCVDLNNFLLSTIGTNYVSIYSSELNSFEIQYSKANENEWTTLPQYTYQIFNLLPGTSYDLRYRGRCTDLTDYVYKKFTTLCPDLLALSITNVGYNSAKVNWSSNYSGNFVIEYSSDNSNWTLVSESGILSQLIPGTQYFIRGKMACTDLNSSYKTISFITACPKLSAFNIEGVTPFSAKLNWVDDTHTNEYIITYAIRSGGSVSTIFSSATSAELKNLIPGTSYIVTVTPQCAGAKNSLVDIFNTDCYSPFDLAAYDITYTTAELRWTTNFDALPFSIDYAISGNNVWQTTASSFTKVTLTNLRPGTEYEARVHINCPDETEPYVSVTFTTNVYDETTIAPNPAEKEITIRPSRNLIGNNFKILDHGGRLIANGKLSSYTIDMSNLSPGMYMLQVDGENPFKIIKK